MTKARPTSKPTDAKHVASTTNTIKDAPALTRPPAAVSSSSSLDSHASSSTSPALGPSQQTVYHYNFHSVTTQAATAAAPSVVVPAALPLVYHPPAATAATSAAPPPPPTSSSSSSSGGGGGNVPDFLYQLTKMLTDRSNRHSIEWSPPGRISVHDPPRLASEVLGRYFRHNKYSSFQRQLNYFGFRKLAGKGKMSPCSYVNEQVTEEIGSLLRIRRKQPGEGRQGGSGGSNSAAQHVMPATGTAFAAAASLGVGLAPKPHAVIGAAPAAKGSKQSGGERKTSSLSAATALPVNPVVTSRIPSKAQQPAAYAGVVGVTTAASLLLAGTKRSRSDQAATATASAAAATSVRGVGKAATASPATKGGGIKIAKTGGGVRHRLNGYGSTANHQKKNLSSGSSQEELARSAVGKGISLGLQRGSANASGSKNVTFNGASLAHPPVPNPIAAAAALEAETGSVGGVGGGAATQALAAADVVSSSPPAGAVMPFLDPSQLGMGVDVTSTLDELTSNFRRAAEQAASVIDADATSSTNAMPAIPVIPVDNIGPSGNDSNHDDLGQLQQQQQQDELPSMPRVDSALIELAMLPGMDYNCVNDWDHNSSGDGGGACSAASTSAEPTPLTEMKQRQSNDDAGVTATTTTMSFVDFPHGIAPPPPPPVPPPSSAAAPPPSPAVLIAEDDAGEATKE